jgi:hypothetical protein
MSYNSLISSSAGMGLKIAGAHLPRKNLGILSRGGVQCQKHHVSPCIDRVELGVDHQLSGSWHSYGKQLPGNDRRLQSPAFGQVGGLPSIPLRRLHRFCLYEVGDLVQWLHEPMPRKQKYRGAKSACDSLSRVRALLQCDGISLPSVRDSNFGNQGEEP